MSNLTMFQDFDFFFVLLYQSLPVSTSLLLPLLPSILAHLSFRFFSSSFWTVEIASSLSHVSTDSSARAL